jgi:DNA-binding beta-propeller fold protein YncE
VIAARTRYLATCAVALALLGCGGGGDDCGAGKICTIAGTGIAGLTEDGMQATDTDLYSPMDMAVGPDGLLYLLDWNNHRVRVIDEEGRVRTVAGTGLIGDGPPGDALQTAFNHPTALAFDAQGRMFVAAWHNSRIKIVDLQAGTLTDYAGTGARAYAGDGGPAGKAILDLPASVAFDAEQNLYVMDQANQVIRKITPDGTISRFAGLCIVGDAVAGQEPEQLGEADKWGWRLEDATTACKADFGGDGGPALEARISQPVGQAAEPAGRLTVDPAGNVYFADSGNNRVRKIDTAGIITTVAGNGTPGFAGDGGPATEAQLNNPVDVEIGPDGSLYIADTYNSCVRAVDPAGTIRTVAGVCGSSGFNGDGGEATAALMDRPFGIELDDEGNLYIADTYNQCIRKVVL